jgi:hypothetical protein
MRGRDLNDHRDGVWGQVNARHGLPLKPLRDPEAAVINGAMSTQRASYFWYYFPKPQAEEGVRAL